MVDRVLAHMLVRETMARQIESAALREFLDAAAGAEEDQRKQSDRRAERDSSKSNRWWLLRRYVSFERFFGGRRGR